MYKQIQRFSKLSQKQNDQLSLFQKMNLQQLQRQMDKLNLQTRKNHKQCIQTIQKHFQLTNQQKLHQYTDQQSKICVLTGNGLQYQYQDIKIESNRMQFFNDSNLYKYVETDEKSYIDANLIESEYKLYQNYNLIQKQVDQQIVDNALIEILDKQQYIYKQIKQLKKTKIQEIFELLTYKQNTMKDKLQTLKLNLLFQQDVQIDIQNLDIQDIDMLVQVVSLLKQNQQNTDQYNNIIIQHIKNTQLKYVQNPQLLLDYLLISQDDIVFNQFINLNIKNFGINHIIKIILFFKQHKIYMNEDFSVNMINLGSLKREFKHLKESRSILIIPSNQLLQNVKQEFNHLIIVFLYLFIKLPQLI